VNKKHAEYFPRKSRGIQVQGKLQEAQCKKTARGMVQTVAAFLTVSWRVLPGSSDPLRCLCSISIPTQSMPSICKISSPRPSFPESWAGPPITCGEGEKRRAKGRRNKLFYSVRIVRAYGKGWRGRRHPGERVDACKCRAAECWVFRYHVVDFSCREHHPHCCLCGEPSRKRFCGKNGNEDTREKWLKRERWCSHTQSAGTSDHIEARLPRDCKSTVC